jgi:hypothetical protein
LLLLFSTAPRCMRRDVGGMIRPAGILSMHKIKPFGFTYEEVMANKNICPFYGKSDDLCDVGCGYISPYDVNQIIRYCSCRHNDCRKFQELADRFPGEIMDLVKC